MNTKPSFLKFLVLLVGLTSAQASLAQTDAGASQEKVYTFVEVAPKYPGGDTELYKFISKNINYPSEDLANATEGKVFVSFIINTEGQVTNVKVEKGVSEGLNNEAVRVVSLLTGFTPATQLGENVNYRYILPISYKHGLSEKKVEKIRKVQEFERQNNLK